MNPALVCIPTYNERDNIRAICEAVLAADSRVDILIVDDNSPDGTGQLADELSAREPRIKVLHREKKQGLGRAYLHAFQWALDARYDYVIEMDADFSHDPRYLPGLLDEAMSGTDLVLGSRYVRGGGTVNWGVMRQIISRGGSLYARSILGVRVRDLTGGFKCFRRKVLESLDLEHVKSSGYGFQIELTYRTLQKGFSVKEIPIVFEDRYGFQIELTYRTLQKGFSVKEIPIVFEDRRVGQSKMSRKIFMEAFTVVWKLRF
jgi:dolichol-phosphate mannosyltransferase